MGNKKMIAGAILTGICILLCMTGCSGKDETAAEKTKDTGQLTIDSRNSVEEIKEDSMQPEESGPDFQSEVESLTAPLMENGEWSVYVYGLTSGKYAVVNDRKLQAASLIKLFICGAAYEHFGEASAKDSTSPETEQLLEAMITVSDNDAANEIISRLGGGDIAAGMEAVNTFCQEKGYVNTHLGRVMLDFTAPDDNYTSAGDCGRLLQDLYNGKLTGSEELIGKLKRQTRTGKIPAGLPEGIATANKTGELETVENDAAIVWGEKETYIICVISNGVIDTSKAREQLKALSGDIYGLLMK